jgi:hypothetical protein
MYVNVLDAPTPTPTHTLVFKCIYTTTADPASRGEIEGQPTRARTIRIARVKFTGDFPCGAPTERLPVRPEFLDSVSASPRNLKSAA